jgi:transcriptional regulator with XRE-family HTH domain
MEACQWQWRIAAVEPGFIPGRLNQAVVTRRRSRSRIRIGVRVATVVREARSMHAWTQGDVSERTGISRQMIAAVESAGANPSLDVLASLFDGLGIDLDLSVRSVVSVDGGRRHDTAHALCSAYVQRRLEAAGWKVAREVRIESGRYLGWIDLLAFDVHTGTLLVIEIKTRLDDVGAIERSMDWHLREAMRAARRIGWRPQRVAGWLLAMATDEVEDQLRADRMLWASTFPARAPELAAAVRDPSTAPDRGLALIDPRSRRRDWLMRARIDGRRSNAPYRGYSDFMARTRGGG